LILFKENIVTTQLVRGLYNLPLQLSGSVVTIGNFDGVHLGHQQLLQKVCAQAKLLNIPSVVVTFEPQPAEFFIQDKQSVPRLTRWREKFHALAECQVDKVLVLRFNQALANLSAEEFVQHILYERLKVKHLIIGDDFRFGKGRRGDFAFLQQAGERYGFTVESMPSVMLNGERISSTRIRQALGAADHATATRFLGHPYFMEGRVGHGDKRGRELGFPTANIFLHRQIAPVQGIYIVRLYLAGAAKGLPGVASLGTRPTVGGTRSLLEVHLFNFNQEIYGQQVRVEFCQKLRAEEHYANLELLREQIERDAFQARVYFEEREEL
jgi:riboflavin kinase/FMN adenylyltransferase